MYKLSKKEPGFKRLRPKQIEMIYTEDVDIATEWAKEHGYIGVHKAHVDEDGLLDWATSGIARGGPPVTAVFQNGTRRNYYDYGDFHYGADWDERHRKAFICAVRLTDEHEEILRAQAEFN